MTRTGGLGEDAERSVEEYRLREEEEVDGVRDDDDALDGVGECCAPSIGMPARLMLPSSSLPYIKVSATTGSMALNAS